MNKLSGSDVSRLLNLLFSMPDSRSTFFPVLATTVHLFIVFTLLDGCRVSTLLLTTSARHSSFSFNLGQSRMPLIRGGRDIGQQQALNVEHKFFCKI
jgi:hypothetical protein